MEDKYQNKYRISSARLPGWNYGWNASYFVTICTKDRENFFGKIVDDEMILSESGVIADVMWYEIKNHAKNVELGDFIVMPNHVHGIIILNEQNPEQKTVTQIMDGPPVETRHALSPDKTNDPSIETRRALSLHKTNDEKIETRRALSLRKTNDPSIETRRALSLQAKQSPQQTDGNDAKEIRQNKTFAQQRFQNQGKNTLSSIVGGYKASVTKHSNRLKFDFAWQPRFHDHIIRDEESFQMISNYIVNNPKNWPKDKFFK